MQADCHIHIALNGCGGRTDEMQIRQALATYQAQAYTYLRDGGDKWGASCLARALAPEHGITYRTPLAPLCKAGHYGSFIGRTYAHVTEYAALVKEQKAAGADFIKIMISGLMDFDRFGVLTEPGRSKEEIQELIHIAHEEGMAVMAHANGARTVEAAAEAGVDSVEHGAYLDQDALEAMKEAGTVWVPTLSAIGNLRGTGRFSEDTVARILENAMKNLASCQCPVAPGTDAGAWAVSHGADTEQVLLAQAGITPERLAQGIKIIQEKF